MVLIHNCVSLDAMAEGILLGAAVAGLVLLFLRFGSAFCDLVCRTIDPAPEIIEEYQP